MLLDILQNNQFATGALMGVASNFVLQKVLPWTKSWLKEIENYFTTTITVTSADVINELWLVEQFFLSDIKKRNYLINKGVAKLGYGRYFVWKKSPIIIYKSRIEQQNSHYDQLYIKAWFNKKLLKLIEDHIKNIRDKKESFYIIKNSDWFSRKIEEKKLLTKNQKKLYEKIKLFFENGNNKKLSIILSSNPGQGKSAAVLNIAHLLKKDIQCISITKSLKLEDLNNYILRASNQIILIEDIDRLPISKEDDNNEYQINKGDLMNVFDGIIEINNCVIIATTNNYDSIDPALIRPGRFDHHMFFENPDQEDIENIAKEYNLGSEFVKNNLGKTLAEIMCEVNNVQIG